jgi:hypothetical protein
VRNFYVPYPLWQQPYASPVYGYLHNLPPALIIAPQLTRLSTTISGASNGFVRRRIRVQLREFNTCRTCSTAS